MNTATENTSSSSIQNPILDPSCHLALDLIELLAVGYGNTENKSNQLRTGFNKVIRSLESARALRLSVGREQQKKLRATLEQIRKIEINKKQEAVKHMLTKENH